jgi:hypothetical protein
MGLVNNISWLDVTSFYSFVNKDGPVIYEELGKCWVWTGYCTARGYGRYKFLNAAYRIAWVLEYGPIAEGMHILHRCDNPSCVRPSHLKQGTHQDNMDDKCAKGRQSHAGGNTIEGAARGDRNGARTKPECLARGANNGKYTHPECTPIGEQHWKSKLTALDVRLIRSIYAKGLLDGIHLAKKFGVHHDTVYSVLNRKTWSHVK